MIVCSHTKATKAEVDAAAKELLEKEAQEKKEMVKSDNPDHVVTEVTEDTLFEKVTGRKFICRGCVKHFTESLQREREARARNKEEKGA